MQGVYGPNSDVYVALICLMKNMTDLNNLHGYKNLWSITSYARYRNEVVVHSLTRGKQLKIEPKYYQLIWSMKLYVTWGFWACMGISLAALSDELYSLRVRTYSFMNNIKPISHFCEKCISHHQLLIHWTQRAPFVMICPLQIYGQRFNNWFNKFCLQKHFHYCRSQKKTDISNREFHWRGTGIFENFWHVWEYSFEV